jgi:hypothetical protein
MTSFIIQPAGAVRSFLAMLLFAAVTGCGEENRTEVDFIPSNEKSVLSTDDVPPELAPVSNTGSVKFSGGGTGSATAQLTPMPGNAITGDLSMRSTGGTGAATVRLTGGSAGQTYGGTIRRGSCEKPGAMVTSLIPITADSLGSGNSYSDVTVPVSQLTSEPHVVTYGPGGRTETCGGLAAAQ